MLPITIRQIQEEIVETVEDYMDMWCRCNVIEEKPGTYDNLHVVSFSDDM